MPTLLARNAAVLVTMDDRRRELTDAGLFARDGIIEQVGPTAQLPKSADVVLDLAGQVALPGFVNTHHHLDQTLTRNLPAAQNNNLFSIDLNTVDYAGALQDPVAATVFCAPQKARYTVINGKVVAERGQVVTVDMAPVIQVHNRLARQFAETA